MLYKMSLSVSEIPPLFVQLDQLEIGNEYYFWKEKARWIRFEEQAEDVLGRWSKPHVATIPQTALDELKELLTDGKMIFDVLLTDMKEIAGKPDFVDDSKNICFYDYRILSYRNHWGPCAYFIYLCLNN